MRNPIVIPLQNEIYQQWCSWSFVTYSSVQHGLLLENHSSIVLEAWASVVCMTGILLSQFYSQKLYISCSFATWVGTCNQNLPKYISFITKYRWDMCYIWKHVFKEWFKQHSFVNLKLDNIPMSRKSFAEKNGSFNISTEDKSVTLSPTKKVCLVAI